MKNLIEIYCYVDNFIKRIQEKNVNIGRPGVLNISSYITLSIFKNMYGIKTNKQLYEFTKQYLQKDFPKLPSYQQFNDGISRYWRYSIALLYCMTRSIRANGHDVHFVDSTALPVCKILREKYAKLFKGIAKKSKSTMGWFYGFKLHLIINQNMEIEAIKFSDANTHDLTVLDGDFIDQIKGFLVGDKGYLSKKKSQILSTQGILLFTKQRKNAQTKLPATRQQLRFIRQRLKIEATFHLLKNNFSLVSSFARSIQSYFANVCTSLLAYSISKAKKLFDFDFLPIF